MNRYINIKAVFNFIPDYLYEEEDETQLLSWILQGYRHNIRTDSWTDDYGVCIAKIVNNKASIPSGIKKIVEVGYSVDIPADDNIDTKTFLTPQVGDTFILLSEAIAYQDIKSHLSVMRYVGQNPELFANECINLFCTSLINFSVNKQLTQITCDESDGYITLVYSKLATDNGDYIIPDNANLMQALSYYCEAMHWRNRRGRKEENANNMFIENIKLANSEFTEFYASEMFKNFDPDTYRGRILGQFFELGYNVQKDNLNRF